MFLCFEDLEESCFNKVILCIQEHAVVFVQVYANPFNGYGL